MTVRAAAVVSRAAVINRVEQAKIEMIHTAPFLLFAEHAIPIFL